MDKYLLAIVALVIFSTLFILYIRISAKNTSIEKKTDDSLDVDNFTLLE